MAMLKTLKTKWLAALRSGKYVQGHRQLRDSQADTYCCLGVLCKVARLKIDEDNDIVVGSPEGRDYDLLTTKLGLPKRLSEKCAQMNDRGGKTFKEIASYLSKNLHTKAA